MSPSESHRLDPATPGEWITYLADHGRPAVIYRGRRIAFPAKTVTLVGGALDQTQVPAVSELVLGTLLRDVLSRQGVHGIDQHRRSIVTAARVAPLFVARIEQSITFSITSDELEAALDPN